ncbi:hypothetical protein IQ235_08460 [Oscillatoriales cyanobacterium LEGE 11467]|uniref:Lipoprotein n=1 Tax=Zarconia navalis LEGE 11467 TaxID=1828826 RepID=A0A928Z8P9_9CYAN|nr:hypothetical protein [Zarconia navalis]MBE9040809.1 hypothetical protein [Zarconia navalis LEGE 11467]
MKKFFLILLATVLLPIGLSSCASETSGNGASETTSSNSETQESGTSAGGESSASDESSAPDTTAVEPSVNDFDSERAALLTDSSRFLAGLEVDRSSPIASLQDSSVWLDHANFLNSAWSRLESQQLSRARTWAAEELQSINQGSPQIFYPFSGPDILYGYTFFPEATDYVMVGLEPVGELPEITPESAISNRLQGVNQSLYAILQYSFFRTKDMAVDLDEQGVLPILFVFLARTNNNILDAQYVGLDENSELQPFANRNELIDSGLVPGVKISFVPEGESQSKTLYYFSTDLSNTGLEGTPEFIEFVKTLDTPTTYLKAASYLMHNESFSTIRDLILTQSSHVLQDDSGMPVRYFDPEQWDRQFYGAYVSPIELFAERYQSDLREIYQTEKDIKGLDFGIGYKFYNDSNLMLATSKERGGN